MHLVGITYSAKSMIDWPRTKDGIRYIKGLSIRSGGGLLMNGSSLYRRRAELAEEINHTYCGHKKNDGIMGSTYLLIK